MDTLYEQSLDSLLLEISSTQQSMLYSDTFGVVANEPCAASVSDELLVLLYAMLGPMVDDSLGLVQTGSGKPPPMA